MKRTLMTLLAALAIVASVPALAQQNPVPAPTPTAGTVTLTTEQFQALLAKTVAGPVAAPAAAPAPDPAKPAVVSAAGILGMDWGTFGSMVVGLIFALLGIIKGGQYLVVAKRVRTALHDVAEAAYLITEKDFGDLPGAEKWKMSFALAAQIFADEHGVEALPAGTAGKLSTIWKKMAAAPKPAAPVVTNVVTPPVDPGKKAADAAAAEAARDVATPGKTALEIAKEASQP